MPADHSGEITVNQLPYPSRSSHGQGDPHPVGAPDQPQNFLEFDSMA